jgi:hypothetical protein
VNTDNLPYALHRLDVIHDDREPEVHLRANR